MGVGERGGCNRGDKSIAWRLLSLNLFASDFSGSHSSELFLQILQPVFGIATGGFLPTGILIPYSGDSLFGLAGKLQPTVL